MEGIIANKYRILKQLGQGAMGEVYLVHPPQGDPVALKLLKTLDEKSGRMATDQFENEFRVLKRLSHPNIGQIFDYGYDETLGKVFFTMPWLQGADIFQATKDLDFEACENLFVQTLRALNTLHQKNLIHCDLKPGNVYVEKNKALLIDFGLAGYFGEHLAGTPTYIAPEVFQTGKHTVTSDLYAVGIIFYNCLTRAQPFGGKDIHEVMERHQKYVPPPIHEINKKVPPSFSEIVATLLSKNPRDRFQSAAAVIEEISAYSPKKYEVETEETLLSYLPTKTELVGRRELQLDIEKSLSDFINPETPQIYHLFLIHGRRHSGKARVVNKMMSDLQLTKINVEKAEIPLSESQKNLLLAARGIVIENVDAFQASEKIGNDWNEFVRVLEQKIVRPDTSRFLLIATAENETDFARLKKLFPEGATLTSSIHLQPYKPEEMREYLERVTGQSDIPQDFFEQFYRNTEGLPGIAEDLIQGMIEKGLLFDRSGRWNADLLAALSQTFDHLEVSITLEQDFERLYANLSDEETELVRWACLCPNGILQTTLIQVCELHQAETLIEKLIERSIFKKEEQRILFVRKIFQNFVRDNLSSREIKKKHTRLAHPNTGLPPLESLYHLAESENPTYGIKAALKLAEEYEKQGKKEEAIAMYYKTLTRFADHPVSEKIKWVLAMVNLMIWLDRFSEAIEWIEKFEKELQKPQSGIDFEDFLVLIEKKGLCHLQMNDLETATRYFETGLKFATREKKWQIHELRFENDLAQIEVVIGNYDDAIALFKKTRDAAQNLDTKARAKLTNNDLGYVYLMQKKNDESLKVLTEDMRIYSSLHEQEPLTRLLYSYAMIMSLDNKNHGKAIQSYEECIRLCKTIHSLPMLLRNYIGLGNLYVAMNQFDLALENYQRALEIAVHLGDVSTKAASLFNQGYIYSKQGNSNLAKRRYMLTIQVLQNKEPKIAFDHFLLGKSYSGLANLALKEENNPAKALGFMLEREKIITVHGQDDEKFSLYADLCEIYMELSMHEKFTECLASTRLFLKTDKQKQRLEDLIHKQRERQDHDFDKTGRIEKCS